MNLTENNNKLDLRNALKRGGRSFAGAAIKMMLMALVLFTAAIATSAQTATIYGGLSNFDVVNHSGHDAHGFEIEIQGIPSSQVPYTFSAERYGAPQIIPTATGIRVRWESPYSGGAFTATTIAYAGGGSFGGTCYMGSANYDTAGCEHFGVSLLTNPTHQHYRWLIEDPANPGTLIAVDPPVALPAPINFIVPPAVEGDAPELEVEFEAPEPPEIPSLYGDAQWVKVFKTELPREVTLDELLTGNPVVPEDPAEVEVSWEIVQFEPAGASGQRGRRQHAQPIRFDSRSVIRRFETYNYTGAYDPLTHEALCADVVCNTPVEGEVGDFLGAQMAAANVSVNSITVNKVGGGTVESADRLIRCGNKCVAGYNRNTQVTLTAIADKGSIFTGWTGACAGSGATCTVGVADAMTTTANFATTVAFSVKTSGKGSIGGSFGINCGKICSATVARGSAATITARPDAGFRFSNWTGACAGSGAVCTLTINGATTTQANFIK